MTTQEYKNIFKSFPEKAWLSSTLQKMIKGGEYDLIIEYLNGSKNIDEIQDVESLYLIKTTFFNLLNDCKIIEENIDKLNLSFIGDFNDIQMTLEEIGIKNDDIFICKKDFLYSNSIQIHQTSEIRIIDISYAGKNSKLACQFVKHMTNEIIKKHMPDSNGIKIVLTFEDLQKYFDRK